MLKKKIKISVHINWIESVFIVNMTCHTVNRIKFKGVRNIIREVTSTEVEK